MLKFFLFWKSMIRHTHRQTRGIIVVYKGLINEPKSWQEYYCQSKYVHAYIQYTHTYIFFVRNIYTNNMQCQYRYSICYCILMYQGLDYFYSLTINKKHCMEKK